VDRCRSEWAREDADTGTGGTGRAPPGPAGIRPRAPLRPAVCPPSQRRRLRPRVSGGSGALNVFARLGLVARGIAYIVIGVIAVMVAFGVARHEPDSAGAIEAIAARPFGYLLLWILVIGFLGLAAWRFVQAAVNRLNLTEGHRASALVYGVGYAIAFFTTLMFVVHGTKPAAGDSSARDYTAHVLSLDGGRVIVAFAGIALVALGIIMAVRGFGAEFTRHLRMGWMSRGTQDAVVRLGQAGYVARGAVMPASGSRPSTRQSPMARPRRRASTGCSARSPSHRSARGCSFSSHSG
jgi:Domain of Unknown Function (DUF1206)